MTDLWPWWTAALAGALHGLHPAGGWVLGAVWRVRRRPDRKTHRAAFAMGLALCVLLALQDAGHSMAPMLWGLCFGAPAGTGPAAAGAWAMAASLIAVHAAAWLAVSAALGAAASRAANAWAMRRAAEQGIHGVAPAARPGARPGG